MRKAALIIGMVIVLVGSVMGGMALHTNAATPTLKVTSFNGVAPGTMTVAGQNWPLGIAVSLYVDAADVEHELARVTPNANGSFIKSFPLGSIDLGDHFALAFQLPATGTAAPFTVTARQLIDEMTSNMLSDMVVNSTYGLQEIKSEVSKAPAFDTDHGSITVDMGSDFKQFSYETITHVSLTIAGTGIQGTPGDKILVTVRVGTNLALNTLAEIIDNNVHTYQFDTKYFQIYVWDGDGYSNAAWDITTLAAMP
jgi:hypothetical protein